MGLFLGDDGQQAELGYTINKAFWGKGYASEAAKGMLQFGFMNLNLHRISARCDSMNTARNELCSVSECDSRAKRSPPNMSEYAHGGSGAA